MNEVKLIAVGYSAKEMQLELTLVGHHPFKH
jgi:hypothetical protein